MAFNSLLTMKKFTMKKIMGQALFAAMIFFVSTISVEAQPGKALGKNKEDGKPVGHDNRVKDDVNIVLDLGIG